MKDDARIQAAIELIQAIGDSPRPADGTMSEFFRGRRFIGSKDRRAISLRVWQMLRHWARDAWHVRDVASRTWAAGGEPPAWHSILPRQRIMVQLVVREGMGLDGVRNLFTGEKFAPKRLIEREETLVRALRGRPMTHRDMPTWVSGEVPQWVLPRLGHLYGEHLPDLLAALTEEASVDLRVNTLKADLEQAVSQLAAEEVPAMPTRWSPLGLRMDGRANLANTKTFRDGLVEVQDEGSQLIALLTDARAGMAVCDFCAGAGGKTLALAAQMENKGRLVACDVSEGRLERSAVRLKRAGVHNVTRRALDSETDKWVKRSAGSFDRVLVDAPCTGTGTWRRNPDAKWRLSEESIDELTATQASVLRSAARLAKPGGRVIYATCSLLYEENEAQIERFLAETADFRLLPVETLWAELIGNDCPSHGGYLRLDPARHGTDGFFAAILERAV